MNASSSIYTLPIGMLVWPYDHIRKKLTYRTLGEDVPESLQCWYHQGCQGCLLCGWSLPVSSNDGHIQFPNLRFRTIVALESPWPSRFAVRITFEARYLYIELQVISEVLRGVYSFKNVRRAPGNSGELQKYVHETIYNLTLTSLKGSTKQSLSNCATVILALTSFLPRGPRP